MSPLDSIPLLHGGVGLETTLLEYLARVFAHLLVFGGVAAVVYWGVTVTETVRSTLRGEPDGDAGEA